MAIALLGVKKHARISDYSRNCDSACLTAELYKGKVKQCMRAA